MVLPMRYQYPIRAETYRDLKSNRRPIRLAAENANVMPDEAFPTQFGEATLAQLHSLGHVFVEGKGTMEFSVFRTFETADWTLIIFLQEGTEGTACSNKQIENGK